MRGGHEHHSRRGITTIGAAIIVVCVGAVQTSCAVPLPAATTTPITQPSATPTPTPTPELTAAERLLATTDDPAACAVTYQSRGVDTAPVLQSEGALYAGLPLPLEDGAVFAGWYSTPAAAAAYDVTARVNGAAEVACHDRQSTLYAGWMTLDAATAAGTEVPILMYHQFTQRPEGEDSWLRGNFAYIRDWDAHMAYIAQTGFYLPTWDELSAFIDGRLYLPPRSVIVTDDDNDATWQQWAAPIATQYKVLTTSFAITIDGLGAELGPYVQKRSHTHDMHTAGENGKGRMVNWSVEQIAADLETSAQILGGTKQVIAYPYGHYDDRSKQGVAAAGFEMARTIEQGYVRPGTDKLALPCIRVNYGMTVDDLARLIG